MPKDKKVDEARKRKQSTHDVMAKVEHELEDLNHRRAGGEDGLTPKIEALRKDRDKAEAAWRDACEQLVQAKAAKKERRSTIDAIHVNLSAGAPHWGGCQDIIVNVCDPTAKKIRPDDDDLVGAGKEPGHASTGDHDPSQVLASARDYRTFNQDNPLRDGVCEALGVEGAVSDYGHYYFLCDGHRFRVQPIASQHGTGPHCHIGLRRA